MAHCRVFSSLAVLSCAVLIGCSLSDPYVQVELPETALSEMSLEHGIAYAHETNRRYRAKLSEETRLSAGVGGGLITLAAAVLGLVAFDAHTDAILGTSLVGGTAYTLGTWYGNDAHELVYLAGMEATSCAVEAVLPLNFSTSSRKSLADGLDTLSEASLKLGGAAAAIRRLIPIVEALAGKETSLTRSAQADLTQADNVLTQSDAAYASGQTLLRSIDGANTNLIAAVDRINVIVDRALQETNPRLEAASSVISQLSSATQILTPGLDLAGTLTSALAVGEDQQGPHGGDPVDGEAEAQDSSEVQLRQALGGLATQTVLVASHARSIVAIVNGVNESRPLKALKTCGVDVESLPLALSLSTNSVTFSSETASSQSVVIWGGKRPYVGRFLQSPTPGIVLRNPISGDSVLEIIAEVNATPGQYQVLIMDAAEHRSILSVLVRGKAPSDRDDQSSQMRTLSSMEVIAEEMKTKQIEVNDAAYEITDAEAFKGESGVKVRVKLTGDPTLDDEGMVKAKRQVVSHPDLSHHELSINEITLENTIALSNDSSDISQWGGQVALLSNADITQIQAALCFDREGADGIWGENTQLRLELWRGREDGTRVDGELNEDEAATLLGSTQEETAVLCGAPWWQ